VRSRPRRVDPLSWYFCHIQILRDYVQSPLSVHCPQRK
jgi:hypothetical protein